MKRLMLPLALLLAALPATNVSTMAQTQTNDTAADGSAATTAAPPVAKKVPRTVEVHGTRLSDDYFWMRDKKNPEVISYLEAENAYTDAMMKPTAALQDKLYKEMLARIKETDQNVPYPLGGYLYYTRTEQGKQYAVGARRKGTMEAPEQVYELGWEEALADGIALVEWPERLGPLLPKHLSVTLELAGDGRRAILDV